MCEDVGEGVGRRRSASEKWSTATLFLLRLFLVNHLLTLAGATNPTLFSHQVGWDVASEGAAAPSPSPPPPPQPSCPYFVNDEIQRCVQPVADYAKVLNQQENSSSSQKQQPTSEFSQAIQLPKLGGQVFKELCRLIRSFEVCIEAYRETCKRHITINLIEASYGFLCNEGYDTFMDSAECLMELDQRPSVKRCHDDTLRNIEKANAQSDATMTVKLEKMCSALNSFSGCVMTPIRRHCGADAWQVIFRVLKDTTKTLMPACHFTTASGTSGGGGIPQSDSRNTGHNTSNNNNHHQPSSSARSRSGHHHRSRHSMTSLSTTTTTSTSAPASPVDPKSTILYDHFPHSDFATSMDFDDRRSFQQPQQRGGAGEGRLKEIQVEVAEDQLTSSSAQDDDEFYVQNYNRRFSNGLRNDGSAARCNSVLLLRFMSSTLGLLMLLSSPFT